MNSSAHSTAHSTCKLRKAKLNGDTLALNCPYLRVRLETFKGSPWRCLGVCVVRQVPPLFLVYLVPAPPSVLGAWSFAIVLWLYYALFIGWPFHFVMPLCKCLHISAFHTVTYTVCKMYLKHYVLFYR